MQVNLWPLVPRWGSWSLATVSAGVSTRAQVSVCLACLRATRRAGRTEHRGANSGASGRAERREGASERSATFLRRLLHLFCLLHKAYLLGQGLDAPEKAHAARRECVRLAAGRVAPPRARAACFTACWPRLACSAPPPAAPCVRSAAPRLHAKSVKTAVALSCRLAFFLDCFENGRPVPAPGTKFPGG